MTHKPDRAVARSGCDCVIPANAGIGVITDKDAGPRLEAGVTQSVVVITAHAGFS